MSLYTPFSALGAEDQPQTSQQKNLSFHDVQSWLVEHIATLLEVESGEFDVSIPFADYGLSSSTALLLVGELETWLGFELSPTLIWEYPNINALAQYLCDLTSESQTVVSLDTEPLIVVDDTSASGDKYEAEAIAIIGIGCRFPGAHGPDAFWQLLQTATDAISEVPPDRWNLQTFYDPDPQAPGKSYTRWGGFVGDMSKFDAHFFGISPREALRMEPQQRMLLEVAWEALEHAAQSTAALSGSKTGVFVGIMNHHEYAQLQIREHGHVSVDDPYFGIGSSASVAAGRLSYVLNLRGPSMAIDTACSSSLTALHYACKSLQSGECHLALVGGVNEMTHPSTIINSCKMGMLSADGRCKTFDARADGFGMGEGCGVVVLKRLSDAHAHGDHILAIVRGSAINQDGQSNGLTAPNKQAQQEVIQAALADAKVTPQQVQYVEAHGSGTALGDSIEMEALAQTLCQERLCTQPLVVGSVKTNIGHLAAAAGIAGLIKTILALQHKTIPAHLHLQQPNPNIDWDKMSVHVAKTTTDWVEGDEPRIAGVSSFGWSGTNVHVIVEEAPQPAVIGDENQKRSHQVIALAGQTETALETITNNLCAYIEEHPQSRLEDIAYTQSAGRMALSYRRIVICKELADVTPQVKAHHSDGVLTGVSPDVSPSIVFMFPGLGDHYIHMASQLYQEEPVFRAAFDTCCVELEHHLACDLRSVLYPAQHNGNGTVSQSNTHDSFSEKFDMKRLLGGKGQSLDLTSPLYQTLFAQPALFAVEYALAQLWYSWGIRPKAMIGYSLGEYVAACLAGVLSLKDALMLVAQRARLIQSLPSGAMLAVTLSEQELQPFLNQEIALAAVNGSQFCVVAGPVEVITNLADQLSAQGVVCQQLQTSHAFHSSMMEAIEQPLLDTIARIELQAPHTPYISNVSGTWITAEQATDPHYWIQHLRHTVRFADGLASVLQTPDVLLLEVGPGTMLGSLAMQHSAMANCSYRYTLSSLSAAYEQSSDVALVLRTLGQLWIAGVPVDWQAVYADQQTQILPLPTYPFERQQYWIDTTKPIYEIASQEVDHKVEDVSQWFYVPTWKQMPPIWETARTSLIEKPLNWVIFAETHNIGYTLAECLKTLNQCVSVVMVGDTFRRIDTDIYTINPRNIADYEALCKHLLRTNQSPQRIVHIWGMNNGNDILETSLDTAQTMGYQSLILLAQALHNQHLPLPIDFTIISNTLYEVVGGEQVHPDQASMLGPCKVIPKEYPGIKCRNIDISLSSNTADMQRLLSQLVNELSTDVQDVVVAYRGSRRWVQSFDPMRLDAAQETIPLLRQHGVYLITGGLGGLGLAVAELLAQTVQARLVLVGRTAIPPREEWENILLQHTDQDLCEKLFAIRSFEAQGIDVLPLSADVSDLTQMQAVVTQTQATFGALHGVFHVAGVPGSGLIQLKRPTHSEGVFAAKVQGTVTLARALEGTTLDFMVLYSSINAITGGLGEVDYCAANAFLDAFAHAYSNRHAIPTTSINWGPWQWDKWQTQIYDTLPEIQKHFTHMRETYGITFSEGQSALRQILTHPVPQILALPRNLQQTFAQAEELASMNFITHDQSALRDRPTYTRPHLRTPYVAPRNATEEKLAAIWQESLGVDRIGINDQFFELGGNSLIGMVIVARVQKEFNVHISVASLFEGPTITTFLDLMYPSHESHSSLTKQHSRGAKRRERYQKKRHTL